MIAAHENQMFHRQRGQKFCTFRRAVTPNSSRVTPHVKCITDDCYSVGPMQVNG
jgi:hypothetical protein